MKTITLPTNQISTSALGFGCSGLMGAGDLSKRLALLGTAFDAGISHFDVAPYYGYGEAEGMLGKFIQSRRDRLTITTKFGIQPPKSNAARRSLVAIFRKIAKLNPGLHKILSKQASKSIQVGVFNVNDARNSLENSLRSLKTDYIDIYLLHDCKLADTDSEDLLVFLENAVRDGKIRAYGIGTGIEEIAAIVDSQPRFSNVVQFENNAIEPNIERLTDREQRSIITHRSIGSRLPALKHFLQENLQIARQWSDCFGLDFTSSSVLPQLMLNYAVRANSQGIVLFSSQQPERIESNVRSVVESIYSVPQIEGFAKLARETLDRL